MSVLSVNTISPRGPRSHRRTLTPRVLLLVGLLLTALLVSVLPRSMAQDTGSVSNPNQTYYTVNGMCYVETVTNTGLDSAGGQLFISAMNQMLGQLGHQANFTFVNGTVTATATVDCPSGTGNSITKQIIADWVLPAIGVAGGLALIVASALAITTVYKKITGRDLNPPGNPDEQQKTALSVAIDGLGGLLANFVMGYGSSGRWQPALSSGVMAIFTTSLVSAYNFNGLQDIMKSWITVTFGFAESLAVGSVSAISGYLDRLRGEVVVTLGKVRG
jgi:hypothetical protein